MSEVYWIAGAANWDSPGGTDAWLDHSGLKPAWIDEIFWLAQPKFQRILNLPEHARQWPVSGPTAHRLLQLIINDMLCGMNDLVLLAESLAQAISLAVLATPQAVGRYNLLPLGRLQPIRGIHSGDMPTNAAKAMVIDLAAKEVEPESVHLMVNPGSTMEMPAALPSMKKLEVDASDGLIRSLQTLLNALRNQTARAGLYVDGTPEIATLLEVL